MLLQVCYHEWRPVDKKNIAVNSLVFHTSQPTWLFCGTNDGLVSLWDVGTPSLPTYDSTNPKQLLKLYPDYGEYLIYCFSVTGTYFCVFSSALAGK